MPNTTRTLFYSPLPPSMLTPLVERNACIGFAYSQTVNSVTTPPRSGRQAGRGRGGGQSLSFSLLQTHHLAPSREEAAAAAAALQRCAPSTSQARPPLPPCARTLRPVSQPASQRFSVSVGVSTGALPWLPSITYQYGYFSTHARMGRPLCLRAQSWS